MKHALRNLPGGAVDAVRSLNVTWIMEFMERQGKPFRDAYSCRTGEKMPADKIALMSLHQMRTALGKRTQSRESYKWLREWGYEGLFGDITHLS